MALCFHIDARWPGASESDRWQLFFISACCWYPCKDGIFTIARFALLRCTVLLLCPKFSIANCSGYPLLTVVSTISLDTGYFMAKILPFMTLTKRDIVMRISSETGVIQTQVFEVVQETLDMISRSLAQGDKVELRNFGIFEVKIRKARIGRNPNKPAIDVPIPNRAMVKFKAGKVMKAEVLKLTPKNK